MSDSSVRFTLSAAAVGKKRQAETAQKQSKVPKVSEMKAMETRAPTPRPSTSAPVNVCCYEVGDNAGDMWALYKETQTKLWRS